MDRSVLDIQRQIYGANDDDSSSSGKVSGPPMLPHGDDPQAYRPTRKRRKVNSNNKRRPDLASPRASSAAGAAAGAGATAAADFPASQLPEGFPPELAFRALAAYSLIRTLSLQLRLSPFTPNVFLRCLHLPFPNKLSGEIHVALLRYLFGSLHMGYHWGGPADKRPASLLTVSKKRKIDGIKWRLRAGDNLEFLDRWTWPVFYDDYFHLTADLVYAALHNGPSYVDYKSLDISGFVVDDDDEDGGPSKGRDGQEDLGRRNNRGTTTAVYVESADEDEPVPNSEDEEYIIDLNEEDDDDDDEDFTPEKQRRKRKQNNKQGQRRKRGRPSKRTTDLPQLAEADSRTRSKRNAQKRWPTTKKSVPSQHGRQERQQQFPPNPYPTMYRYPPPHAHAYYHRGRPPPPPPPHGYRGTPLPPPPQGYPPAHRNSNNNNNNMPNNPYGIHSRPYGMLVKDPAAAAARQQPITRHSRQPLTANESNNARTVAPSVAPPTASAAVSTSMTPAPRTMAPAAAPSAAPQTMAAVRAAEQSRELSAMNKQLPSTDRRQQQPTVTEPQSTLCTSRPHPPNKNSASVCPITSSSKAEEIETTVDGQVSCPSTSRIRQPTLSSGNAIANHTPHHRGSNCLAGQRSQMEDIEDGDQSIARSAPSNSTGGEIVKDANSSVARTNAEKLPEITTPLIAANFPPHQTPKSDILGAVTNGDQMQKKTSYAPNSSSTHSGNVLINRGTNGLQQTGTVHQLSSTKESLNYIKGAATEIIPGNSCAPEHKCRNSSGDFLPHQKNGQPSALNKSVGKCNPRDKCSSSQTVPVPFSAPRHHSNTMSSPATIVSAPPAKVGSSHYSIAPKNGAKHNDVGTMLDCFIRGKPVHTKTNEHGKETAASTEEEKEEADLHCESDHWPHYRPVKSMRSGVPHHRLPLEEKLDILEFLLDELLSVDAISAEITKRHVKTSTFSAPYGALPSAEELENIENDDECAVCRKEGELLCCDGCPASYHRACLDLSKYGALPDGQWLCPECRLQDSAKFGTLNGGRKSSLDWFTPSNTDAANFSCRDVANSAETFFDSLQSTPYNTALSQRPQITKAPITMNGETSDSLSEFLVVHGFVFQRSRSSPVCEKKEVCLVPLDRTGLRENLIPLGPKVASAWPTSQIPCDPKLLWEGLNLPAAPGTGITYLLAIERYDPSFYQNKYRLAPLPQPLRKVNEIQLREYEMKCCVAQTQRLSNMLSKEGGQDGNLSLALRSGVSLFDPYEPLRVYMLGLETRLRKAHLLDEFWGIKSRVGRKEVWSKNVKNCRSIPRLSTLLGTIVDSINIRAFAKNMFQTANAKLHESPSTKESAEESEPYFHLASDSTGKAESQRRHWERCDLAQMPALLAKESSRLEAWIGKLRPDLVPDLVRGRKRKQINEKNPKKESYQSSRNDHGPIQINESPVQKAIASANSREIEENKIIANNSVISVKCEDKEMPAIQSSGSLEHFPERVSAASALVEPSQTNGKDGCGKAIPSADPISFSKSDTCRSEKVPRQKKKVVLGEETGLVEATVSPRRGNRRRSGRILTKHGPSDNQIDMENFSGKNDDAKTLIDKLKKKKLSKLLDEVEKIPFFQEPHWPFAGRKLFDPDGKLPTDAARRLGRNAGGIVAPFLTYNKKYEVGQVTYFHVWRKRISSCTSYEELLLHIKILESFLDTLVIVRCASLSQRSEDANARVRSRHRVYSTQKDLLTGIDYHLIVREGQQVGQWSSSLNVDLSPFVLDRCDRRKARVNSFTHRFRHILQNRVREQVSRFPNLVDAKPLQHAMNKTVIEKRTSYEFKVPGANPLKRKRGRPKGSKNKKAIVSAGVLDSKKGSSLSSVNGPVLPRTGNPPPHLLSSLSPEKINFETEVQVPLIHHKSEIEGLIQQYGPSAIPQNLIQAIRLRNSASLKAYKNSVGIHYSEDSIFAELMKAETKAYKSWTATLLIPKTTQAQGSSNGEAVSRSPGTELLGSSVPTSLKTYQASMVANPGFAATNRSPRAQTAERKGKGQIPTQKPVDKTCNRTASMTSVPSPHFNAAAAHPLHLLPGQHFDPQFKLLQQLQHAQNAFNKQNRVGAPVSANSFQQIQNAGLNGPGLPLTSRMMTGQPPATREQILLQQMQSAGQQMQSIGQAGATPMIARGIANKQANSNLPEQLRQRQATYNPIPLQTNPLNGNIAPSNPQANMDAKTGQYDGEKPFFSDAEPIPLYAEAKNLTKIHTQPPHGEPK